MCMACFYIICQFFYLIYAFIQYSVLFFNLIYRYKIPSRLVNNFSGIDKKKIFSFLFIIEYANLENITFK